MVNLIVADSWVYINKNREPSSIEQGLFVSVSIEGTVLKIPGLLQNPLPTDRSTAHILSDLRCIPLARSRHASRKSSSRSHVL